MWSNPLKLTNIFFKYWFFSNIILDIEIDQSIFPLQPNILKHVKLLYYLFLDRVSRDGDLQRGLQLRHSRGQQAICVG